MIRQWTPTALSRFDRIASIYGASGQSVTFHAISMMGRLALVLDGPTPDLAEARRLARGLGLTRNERRAIRNVCRVYGRWNRATAWAGRLWGLTWFGVAATVEAVRAWAYLVAGWALVQFGTALGAFVAWARDVTQSEE